MPLNRSEKIAIVRSDPREGCIDCMALCIL